MTFTNLIEPTEAEKLFKRPQNSFISFSINLVFTRFENNEVGKSIPLNGAGT